MSQVEELIREHEERCMKELPTKYVHWYWVVGGVLAIAVAYGSTAWALSNRLTVVEINATTAKDKAVELEDKMNSIIEMQDDIKWIKRKLSN